jgi:uncharacterized protein YeaO (DUF488 family)
MASKHTVKVGRVYDGRAWGDGNRVLVDRLWPRGLATVDVDLDEWCKQVAPSTTLRAWYGHDPERFIEFAQRYRAELGDLEHAEALDHLGSLATRRNLTLLTATKYIDISHATVLVNLLASDDRR